MWKLETEVTLGIVGADVFNDLAQEFHISGIFAVFDPGADQVAQNPAEVLVAGIAQEGAESVSMPMKLPRMPSWPREIIWSCMPTLLSLNHQAEPC